MKYKLRYINYAYRQNDKTRHSLVQCVDQKFTRQGLYISCGGEGSSWSGAAGEGGGEGGEEGEVLKRAASSSSSVISSASSSAVECVQARGRCSGTTERSVWERNVIDYIRPSRDVWLIICLCWCVCYPISVCVILGLY